MTILNRLPTRDHLLRMGMVIPAQQIELHEEYNRFKNKDLIVLELDEKSFWVGLSDFEDSFDIRHSIDPLRDGVYIIRRLPKRFSRNYVFEAFKMPLVHWPNEKYHIEQTLPLISKHKGLKITLQIETFGHKLICILQEKGPFVALHLRYKMDMLVVKHEEVVEQVKKLFTKLSSNAINVYQLVLYEPTTFIGFEITFEGAYWIDADSIVLIVMEAMLGSRSKNVGGENYMGSVMAMKHSVLLISPSVGNTRSITEFGNSYGNTVSNTYYSGYRSGPPIYFGRSTNGFWALARLGHASWVLHTLQPTFSQLMPAKETRVSHTTPTAAPPPPVTLNPHSSKQQSPTTTATQMEVMAERESRSGFTTVTRKRHGGAGRWWFELTRKERGNTTVVVVLVTDGEGLSSELRR
ncbi:hypothetical protein GQ457_12G010600 [Hibiscus cannabinus]